MAIGRVDKGCLLEVWRPDGIEPVQSYSFPEDFAVYSEYCKGE